MMNDDPVRCDRCDTIWPAVALTKAIGDDGLPWYICADCERELQLNEHETEEQNE